MGRAQGPRDIQNGGRRRRPWDMLQIKILNESGGMLSRDTHLILTSLHFSSIKCGIHTAGKFGPERTVAKTKMGFVAAVHHFEYYEDPGDELHKYSSESHSRYSISNNNVIFASPQMVDCRNLKTGCWHMRDAPVSIQNSYLN